MIMMMNSAELQDEALCNEDLHPDFNEQYDLSDDLGILSTSCHNEPPIFKMVCSTFDFSALKISLTLLGITFYKSTFTFMVFFGLVPLAGSISGGLENTTGWGYSLHI